MPTLSCVRPVWSGLLLLVAAGLPLFAGGEDGRQREPIGVVLGRTVYRDEIRTGENVRLRDELHRLFTAPVMQEYRKLHEIELTPTELEITTATNQVDRKHRERLEGIEAQLRAKLATVEQQLAGPDLTAEDRGELEIERSVLQSQLKPPGRSFAVFMLTHWKFQRHLYDRYGGGRILWQQAGIEAFDAMHNWLQAQEAAAKFRIDDPKLRDVFYEYWTTTKHGPFLSDDEERIRHEFLEPEWLAPPAARE